MSAGTFTEGTFTILAPPQPQSIVSVRLPGEDFARVQIMVGGEILVGDGTCEPTEISVVEFLRRVAREEA